MLLKLLNYLLLLTLFFSSALHALSTDKNQPIDLEADSVEIDDKKGLSIYKGKVKYTQGSIKITAAIVRVYTVKRALNKIVAIGQPATFKQTPDGNKEDVHARANRMEYLANSDLLILTQQAKLWQGKNVFTSERIEYNKDKAVVKAGSSSSQKSRVKATIQPRNKQ